MDGISTPKVDLGKWREVLLVDMPEDYDESQPFLNELFFESYDEWESRSQNIKESNS